MAIIKPFKALRPQPQLVKQVASKPYDVMNVKEAKIEAQGNPDSFLHITRSEIDLPENTDVYSQKVYDKAKENLTAFIKRDVLFRENKDCYYIYRLTMNGKTQTGLVCVSSLDDYDNNIIKKHEFTTPVKEEDRINHIKTTGAQTGNVFMAYRNNSNIDSLVENWIKTKTAVYDFIDEDNIQHTVWIISDTNISKKITAVFEEEITATYIADGHHRAASAAKVRKESKDAAHKHADYFLTTLFPSSQLQIMGYNRAIKDLNGLTAQNFLYQIQKDFTVEKVNEAYQPKAQHEFGMYLENNWYKLISKQNSYSNNPVTALDITILQDKVLSKLLNIYDQRTDKRIDFVGGIKGLKELETRVNIGEMAVAFSLFPVTIEQLFAVADSGNVMPPKSTWFEPKLRDGLFTHLINE